jgi:hypothetical protein
MNPPVTEDDLRRLSQLEPTPGDVDERVRARLRHRQRRSRTVLTLCLVGIVAILGAGLWQLGPSDGSSVADQPATDSTSLPSPSTTVVAPAPAPEAAADEVESALPRSSCEDGGPSLVVFMDISATVAQIEGVRALVVDSAAVERSDFVDQDGAYEEFREAFAESPEMVASVSAEDFPVSFRVVLRVGAPDSALDELVDLPGVRTILAEPCSPGFHERHSPSASD